MAGRVVACLWSIAVLRLYDHPLATHLLRAASGLTDAHADRLRPVGRQQLTQFMLLAAADSRLDDVHAVPVAVRNRCVLEWKSAPPTPRSPAAARARAPAARYQKWRAGAVAASVAKAAGEKETRTAFEQVVDEALRALGLNFSRNVASKDGAMVFTFLMHHRPECAPCCLPRRIASVFWALCSSSCASHANWRGHASGEHC